MPCMSAYRLPWQVKTRPSPSVLVLVVPSDQVPGIAAETWSTPSSASGVSGSGGGGGVRTFSGPGAELPSRSPLVSSSGRTPARVGDQRAGHRDRRHRGGDADGGVRASPGRPGPHHDRRARPPDRLQRRRQRLEDGADAGGGDVAVHRELRGGRLQLPLGRGAGDADLAGHAVDRQRGEVGQQQHLALGRRQLAERVEGGPRRRRRCPSRGPTTARCCRRWARVQASGRTQSSGSSSRETLRQWCQATTKRVADRALGGAQVAGQRVGLQQQPAPDVLVERLEPLRAPRSSSGEGSGTWPHTVASHPEPDASRRGGTGLARGARR